MRINVNQRKNRERRIRLLCFLISGLLVMTVSAAVYNYATLEASSISARAAKVVFADGVDATQAGTSVGTNGTYVLFTSLSGWPNATRVYENATIIRNTDSAVDFACLLTRDSWSGNTGSLSQLYIKIFDASGVLQGTLDAVAGNNTAFTIPHGAVWRVEWDIKWSATALSTDTIAAILTLRITGEGTGE